MPVDRAGERHAGNGAHWRRLRNWTALRFARQYRRCCVPESFAADQLQRIESGLSAGAGGGDAAITIIRTARHAPLPTAACAPAAAFVLPKCFTRRGIHAI